MLSAMAAPSVKDLGVEKELRGKAHEEAVQVEYNDRVESVLEDLRMGIELGQGSQGGNPI